MSRSQKIVLIALGAMLLAFVAVVIYGQTRPRCEGDREACAKSYEPGGTVNALGKLFGSRSSAVVVLGEDRYTIAPGGGREIPVPSSDSAVRTLKLKLEAGQAAALVYTNAAPNRKPIETRQDASLPISGKSGEERLRTAFSVTDQGGVLKVTCFGPTSCVIVPR